LQRYCIICEPFVTIFKNLLVNPPVNPPVNPLVIQPFGFLSCLCSAPLHILRPLAAYYTACNALYFMLTDSCFKLYCKKNNIILPLVCEPSLYLIYLLISNNLLCCSFCTNICAYNCALAFMFISYKKDI
jgi:hypothetical protein